MSDDAKRDRIPLPPILLSVIAWWAMAAGGAVAIMVAPLGPIAMLLGFAIVFALPVLFIAKRVRR